MPKSADIHYRMGGVVSEIDTRTTLKGSLGIYSVLYLEEIPGAEQSDSYTIIGGLVTDEVIGKLVDIDVTVTGKGRNRLIRHVVETSSDVITTEANHRDYKRVYSDHYNSGYIPFLNQ